MNYETEDKEFPVDDSMDEEMRALLESWKAADAPASLDHRMMAAYRREMSPPFWKRALASSIRVPLPVAAAVILLLLALGIVALRSSPIQVITNLGPPETRVVEVPVVQEKIVTRTIYVEKKRSAKMTADRQTPGQYIAQTQGRDKRITANQESSGQYFTLANLSGFQPVSQMKIEVIKGAKTDEN
ncbi:MAG TPA: hypothetical protein VID27_08930 [Blastocatellia bacterium]|jgi:hypothetical protein